MRRSILSASGCTFPRYNRMHFYDFGRAVLGVLFRVLYRVRIVGRENEPREGAFLTIANHISFLDPIFIAIALRRKQRFIAKQALTSHFVLRLVFRVFNVLTVQEGENNLAAFRAAIRTLKKGDCIAIFPQGKRIPGADPLPSQAMGGLLVIANNAQADILPVSIAVKGNKPRPFRRTTVIIGKPVPYTAYHAVEKRSGRNEAAAYCFSHVCAPITEGSI